MKTKINKLIKFPMTEPITIQAKEVRSCFGEMLDNVRFTHKSYLITKQKKPAGVLLGIREYEDLIDMLDTMAEERDPQFQADLMKSHEEYLKGEVVSEGELDNIIKAKIKNAKQKV